jgi:hypothetical protein
MMIFETKLVVLKTPVIMYEPTFENTRFPEGLTLTKAVELPFDVKLLAKLRGV